MTLQDMVIHGLLFADILEGLDALDGEVEKNVMLNSFHNVRGDNQTGWTTTEIKMDGFGMQPTQYLLCRFHRRGGPGPGPPQHAHSWRTRCAWRWRAPARTPCACVASGRCKAPTRCPSSRTWGSPPPHSAAATRMSGPGRAGPPGRAPATRWPLCTTGRVSVRRCRHTSWISGRTIGVVADPRATGSPGQACGRTALASSSCSLTKISQQCGWGSPPPPREARHEHPVSEATQVCSLSFHLLVTNLPAEAPSLEYGSDLSSSSSDVSLSCNHVSHLV